jgi:hypothetical protein
VNKQVSSLFAVIVIVVVVALGALYFLVRFRAAEERYAAETRALQAYNEAARRGRWQMTMQRRANQAARLGRGARRGRAPGAPGGVVPGGSRAPSEQRGAERSEGRE